MHMWSTDAIMYVSEVQMFDDVRSMDGRKEGFEINKLAPVNQQQSHYYWMNDALTKDIRDWKINYIYTAHALYIVLEVTLLSGVAVLRMGKNRTSFAYKCGKMHLSRLTPCMHITPSIPFHSFLRLIPIRRFSPIDRENGISLGCVQSIYTSWSVYGTAREDIRSNSVGSNLVHSFRMRWDFFFPVSVYLSSRASFSFSASFSPILSYPILSPSSSSTLC